MSQLLVEKPFSMPCVIGMLCKLVYRELQALCDARATGPFGLLGSRCE